MNMIAILTFEIFKRYSNKRYYKQENESWWRFWEYGVFLTAGLYLFIYPTFLIASVVGFSKNLEYKTSEKRIKGVEDKEQ